MAKKKKLKALAAALAALSSSIAAEAAAEDKQNKGKKGGKKDYGSFEVSGEGLVRVAPDIVWLHYTVDAIKLTPEEARTEVEKTVAALSDEVATLHLDDKAFIANNISVTPYYEYNKRLDRDELKGYQAKRNITIELKDFSLIGKITDMAIKAGINQIANFVYDVTDRHKYELEAARRAIANANERAQLLADGFHVKLGHAYNFGFSSRSRVYDGAFYSCALAPQESSPEHVAKSVYSADQIEIKSQVTASFRIAGVKDSQDAE